MKCKYDKHIYGNVFICEKRSSLLENVGILDTLHGILINEGLMQVLYFMHSKYLVPDQPMLHQVEYEPKQDSGKG